MDTASGRPMLGPLYSAFKLLEQRYCRTGIQPLQLGLNAIDDCIGGLEPGDLVVIGSSNPVLRISLATQVAVHVSRALAPTASRVDVFSPSKKAHLVVGTALAQALGVQQTRILSGRLRPDERARCDAMQQGLTWELDDRPETHADTIESRLQRLSDRTLRLAVILGEVQNMAALRQGGSLTERITEQCDRLKQVARQLDAIVIVTSGFNKERVRHFGEPFGRDLSDRDLYGSGLISDIADLTFVLERIDKNAVEAILLHDREGERRRFLLFCDSATLRWQCATAVDPSPLSADPASSSAPPTAPAQPDDLSSGGDLPCTGVNGT